MAKPLLLGIEIGGTKLQIGLGHGDGRLLSLRRAAIEPTRGAEAILAQVAEEADRACWEINASRDKVDAVGIGFGGPVDAEAGRITKSHHVPGWDGFPLADWVRRNLGIAAVALHNDADTAGLGEARFGAGVGRSPVLYVTVGSGIGGGLILDGRIYRGAGHGAVEIGHLWVAGRPSGPGAGPTAEILEHAASGWSIARRGREAVAAGAGRGGSGTMADLSDGDPDQVTAEVVAVAASFGDPEARGILDHATRSMASGLAHATTLLAPRRIILGGGVSLIGEDLWLQPIRAQLDRLVFPPFRDTYDVVAASLGEEVVVHGALALARDLFKALQEEDKPTAPTR